MDGDGPISEDYSAAATLIPFPRPVPLLRHPIEAGPSDEPSSGPYLLAFKSKRDWASSYGNCVSQIISQCVSGARIGCSIAASNKCKQPWWRVLLGNYSNQDFSERAKCEEIEMQNCLPAAKEKCSGFAKGKCEAAFRKARIEVELGKLDAFGLISVGCFGNEKSFGVKWCKIDKYRGQFRNKFRVTNVKGTDLLGPEMDMEEYLRKNNI